MRHHHPVDILDVRKELERFRDRHYKILRDNDAAAYVDDAIFELTMMEQIAEGELIDMLYENKTYYKQQSA